MSQASVDVPDFSRNSSAPGDYQGSSSRSSLEMERKVSQSAASGMARNAILEEEDSGSAGNSRAVTPHADETAATATAPATKSTRESYDVNNSSMNSNFSTTSTAAIVNGNSKANSEASPASSARNSTGSFASTTTGAATAANAAAAAATAGAAAANSASAGAGAASSNSSTASAKAAVLAAEARHALYEIPVEPDQLAEAAAKMASSHQYEEPLIRRTTYAGYVPRKASKDSQAPSSANVSRRPSTENTASLPPVPPRPSLRHPTVAEENENDDDNDGDDGAGDNANGAGDLDCSSECEELPPVPPRASVPATSLASSHTSEPMLPHQYYSSAQQVRGARASSVSATSSMFSEPNKVRGKRTGSVSEPSSPVPQGGPVYATVSPKNKEARKSPLLSDTELMRALVVVDDQLTQEEEIYGPTSPSAMSSGSGSGKNYLPFSPPSAKPATPPQSAARTMPPPCPPPTGPPPSRLSISGPPPACAPPSAPPPSGPPPASKAQPALSAKEQYNLEASLLYSRVDEEVTGVDAFRRRIESGTATPKQVSKKKQS